MLLGLPYGMPTVLRKRGFRVMIYVDDHEPPHVHAWKGSSEVVVLLAAGGGRPWIREHYSATRRMQLAALRLVAEHNDFLLGEWRRIHG